MKRIQINRNVIDENILGELKRQMIEPWRKLLLIATVIVALVLAVINFSTQEIWMGCLFFVLGGACFVEIFWLSQKKYKDVIKTMEKETGKTENIYTMIFGNDGLTIHNCDMGTDNKMIYTSIQRIVETKSTYTIFGKKNQFAIIRKDCLKVSIQELCDFLKTKDTHIKRWPKA